MMTFIEKFDALKKKYGKIDESKLTENFAVQVEMTDDDCGGIFYVAYMTDKSFEIQPYDYHDNTASVTVSSDVLEKILSGKTDAVAAFFAGKLKVEGNLSHAIMLVDLMKKEPAKKTAKKTEDAPKAEEKKPTKKRASTKKSKS